MKEQKHFWKKSNEEPRKPEIYVFLERQAVVNYVWSIKDIPFVVCSTLLKPNGIE